MFLSVAFQKLFRDFRGTLLPLFLILGASVTGCEGYISYSPGGQVRASGYAVVIETAQDASGEGWTETLLIPQALSDDFSLQRAEDGQGGHEIHVQTQAGAQSNKVGMWTKLMYYGLGFFTKGVLGWFTGGVAG